MRVALSQRVEQVVGYGERRDCLDQRWARLGEHLGIHVAPLPNGLEKPAAWLENGGIGGLILTGGNDLAHLPQPSNAAAERDATECAALAWAAAHGLPVLGVCRGMQMINVYLGGKLCPIAGHVGVRHPVLPNGCDARFAERREVNSYHGWGIRSEGLATSVDPTMVAEDGSVEAFVARDLPWTAVMWHPEREDEIQPADARLIRSLFAGRAK